MKKILFLTNFKSPNVKPKLSNFTLPSYYAAISMNYEFHMNAPCDQDELVSNEYNVVFHKAPIYRRLISCDVIKTYKIIKKLLKEEKFDAIHCNTPIGGLLGRLSGKKLKVPKIIYTAHGFHFYKEAPLINRILFKTAEKWLAHYTDAIITMNEEDYKAAKQFKLRNNGNVYFIHGVGVNTNFYKVDNPNKGSLRKNLGLNSDDIVLISMGDLIRRKNYKSSIKAIAMANNKKLHFLICGKGPELDALQSLAKELNVEDQIHFLGFRTDIKELLSIADVFLFTTYQEGLPRSMMEAMAAGLPCIASNVRGNVDLIEDGKGGFLRNPNDIIGIGEAINILANDESLRRTMSVRNLEEIKKFDIENVKKEMKNIYIDVLGGDFNEKT